MGAVTVNITDVLNDVYKPYLKAWKRREIYYGGAGSGKSVFVTQKLVTANMDGKGKNILVVRQVGKTNRTSTFALFKRTLRQFNVLQYYRINESDMRIKCLANNKEIIFTGLDDVEKLKSITFEAGDTDVVWVEEASETEQDDIKQLDLRLRGKGTTILSFNPVSIGHWLKQAVDMADDDTLVLKTTYKDNKFLVDAYRKELEAYQHTDEYYYKVYCLGEWGNIGGQYFGEWRDNIHVVQPFKIPSDWRRYLSIDYGLDMLAALWIAVDWHGKAYVYREAYQKNLIISKAAEHIKLLEGDDRPTQRFAPPDLFNRRQETGKSAIDIFSENGLYFYKSNNNRVQGWYDLKEWLNPYTDEQGILTARLVVFDSCKNLIRTLPQLERDEHNPNDVSDKNHELTHAPDALRGFVCGRPCAPVKPIVHDEDYVDPDRSFLDYGT